MERDVGSPGVREVLHDSIHGRDHEVHVDGRRDAVLAQRRADHGADRQVRDVVVVHDVEVHDVRAGGERRVDLGAELREVGAQDRRRDEEVLLGHDELHLHLGPRLARPRGRQRLGDERIRGGEGEGDDEGLHLFFLTCVRLMVPCCAVGRDSVRLLYISP